MLGGSFRDESYFLHKTQLKSSSTSVDHMGGKPKCCYHHINVAVLCSRSYLTNHC